MIIAYSQFHDSILVDCFFLEFVIFFSSSDDNMLRNIELFDRLSLRFNKRVLFIKDMIGDEICQWSFYGKQRKVAEICCTSIVYATEKKQTKVTAAIVCTHSI